MKRLQGKRRLIRQGTLSSSKLYFIFGSLIILGIALSYISLTYHALKIRAATSSEFNQYVISHHIGTAEEVSDLTGFQADFCVLYLNHPMQQSDVTTTVLNLLYQYHELDGGMNLTVDYRKPGTPKTTILAEATYDHSSQTVSMVIYNEPSTKLVNIQVNWSANWYTN